MINTILFDLDGTLLLMEQEDFVRDYFARLCKRLAPHGFAQDKLSKSLWKGTAAMAENDGSKLNCDRFWDEFSLIWGKQVRELEPVFEDFYGREFDETKHILGKPGGRRGLIDTLKKKGYTLVLATNPLFPPVAVATRLRWIDLEPADFQLITTYDNSHYCKPSPGYFQEILKEIEKQPMDCIMIGNNTSDDMAALTLGMGCFLVTDYLENDRQLDVTQFTHGTFSDLCVYLDALPTCSKYF